jgi:hypothetical protein
MVIKQLRTNRILRNLTTLVSGIALITTLNCSEIQNPISPQPEKKRPETKITQTPTSTFKQGDFARVIWSSPDKIDGYYIKIDDAPEKRTGETNLDISNQAVGTHRLLIRAISHDENNHEITDFTPEIFFFTVQEPDIRILARSYFPLDTSPSSLAYNGTEFITLLMNQRNFHISVLKVPRTMSGISSISLEGMLHSGIATNGSCYWTSRLHELTLLDQNFKPIQPPLRFDDIQFHNVAFDPIENKLWSNGYTSGNYKFFKHNPEDLSIESSCLAPREPLKGFTFHNEAPYSVDMYGKTINKHRRSDLIVREEFSLPQSSSLIFSGLASDGKSLCALAYDPYPLLVELELRKDY